MNKKPEFLLRESTKNHKTIVPKKYYYVLDRMKQQYVKGHDMKNKKNHKS